MRVHYPRTPHLPWSPGASADDVRAVDLSGFAGREVVVTEKLDGENTTLYADGLHARSLDSAHHPSRTWVKGLQGRIGAAIPSGWRVCGENLFARHAIAYQDLDSWFYGFSVWDGDRCLDWDRTVRFLRGIGVPTPPVLWRGVFDERALRALRLDLTRQEGYVVRTVDGFAREDFDRCVAKWVRRGHVQTDTHWMYASVVENGLGPAAALWAVRSGAEPEVAGLLAALGFGGGDELDGGEGGGEGERERGGVERARLEAMVGDAAARLGALGRTGDARLAGVSAALLHGVRRSRLAPRLSEVLGMPLARRIADLVGLYGRLHQPFPAQDRRAGLIRMAFAADLGVLHAVARSVLLGRDDAEAAAAREQIDWSEMYAEDAGLLVEAPLEALRLGLRDALLGDAGLDADAADRCWAQAREAYAEGRISTVEEAVAATWRWRSGTFPRLIQLVGPSGSGKSSFAGRLSGIDMRVSLDDLRLARGSRADQRANPEVLREGLERLDAALGEGGTVVWDATSINRQQRSLVQAVAARRDALVTHAVMLVDEDELLKRNAGRENAVPPEVVAAQVRRFAPPYPGEAHRTWYVGSGGAVEDVAGVLSAEGL